MKTEKEFLLDFIKELVLNPECQKHGKIKESFLIENFGTADIARVSYNSQSDGYIISE